MGDLGSIPGLGKSLGWEDPLEKGKDRHSLSAGERIDYPLQYSGMENSMDCTVSAKSQTRLSNFH